MSLYLSATAVIKQIVHESVELWSCKIGVLRATSSPMDMQPFTGIRPALSLVGMLTPSSRRHNSPQLRRRRIVFETETRSREWETLFVGHWFYGLIDWVVFRGANLTSSHDLLYAVRCLPWTARISLGLLRFVPICLRLLTCFWPGLLHILLMPVSTVLFGQTRNPSDLRVLRPIDLLIYPSIQPSVVHLSIHSRTPPRTYLPTSYIQSNIHACMHWCICIYKCII